MARPVRTTRTEGDLRARRKITFNMSVKLTLISVAAILVVEGFFMVALAKIIGDAHKWPIVVGLFFGLAGVGAIVAFFFSQTIVGPIKDILRDLLAIRNGDLARRTKVKHGDEIGLLAEAVNDLAESLEEADKDKQVVSKLQDDMSLAGEIQQMLLPQAMPKVPTIDLYPYYQAAGQLGGDYYDFIPVSPTHLGVIIADVSGKGITGSMIMAVFRSELRRFAENEMSTMEVLKKTNELLSRDIPRGMFVTSYYLVLDIPKNEINFSCAGHTPMVIYRATSGSIELVKPGGMALGFDTGIVFNRNIQQHRILLRPGDRVVFYTDGVIEAMNRRGEKFGENRLYRFIKENADQTSKELVSGLRDELDTFRAGAEPSDDVTLVTFKVL
ncbi:MAG: PP2C family protein-serine/threonine phosphatase [Candidatus Brocadiia bacterium]